MAASLILLVSFLSAYILLFAIAGLLIPISVGKEDATKREGALTRFFILVPAHNESEYLRPTLRSLRALLYPKDRFHIVVIADNCTDDTALIAMQEGCEVWKREDITLRGKGHALAWAFRRPHISSYDAAVVVDADTTVSSNLLQAFDREIICGHAVIQARYIFEFPPDTSIWLRLISYASKRAEDCFISRPRSRFQLYQGLQGNGFCLRTQVLKNIPWCSSSICEDLEYGLDLASYGTTVDYLEDAHVTAVMTGRLQHASGQRKRWAGGAFLLIAKRIPVLLTQAFRKHDWKSLEACIYLVTLSRLPLLMLTGLTAAFLLMERHSVHAIWWVVFAISLILQGAYGVAMLSTTRKESGFGRMILGLPVYILWLSWQQLVSLCTLRNSVWNRTERG